MPNGVQHSVAANGVDHQLPVHHTKVGQPVFVKEHEPRKPTGSEGKTFEQTGQEESNEEKVRREQAAETAPVGPPVNKGRLRCSCSECEERLIMRIMHTGQQVYMARTARFEGCWRNPGVIIQDKLRRKQAEDIAPVLQPVRNGV